MHPYKAVIVGCLLALSSCNVSPTAQQAANTGNLDTVKLKVTDPYATQIINIPPPYSNIVYDSVTINQFMQLAQATHGSMSIIVSPKLITQHIAQVIKEQSSNGADILILMDKTSSMEDDMANVKAGLQEIIDAVKMHDQVRFAIALYGDKNADGPFWFDFKNFETQYDQAKDFIQNAELTNGDDYPESVYDAIMESLRHSFWRSNSKRIVLLIGDAPALEAPLSDFSLNDVIKKATDDNITMNFYPIVLSPLSKEEMKEVQEKPLYVLDTLVQQCYPNPANQKVQITFKNKGPHTISLLDVSGKLLFQETHEGDQWSGDVSTYANGLYLLRIVGPNETYEHIRLVVQH